MSGFVQLGTLCPEIRPDQRHCRASVLADELVPGYKGLLLVSLSLISMLGIGSDSHIQFETKLKWNDGQSTIGSQTRFLLGMIKPNQYDPSQ